MFRFRFLLCVCLALWGIYSGRCAAGDLGGHGSWGPPLQPPLRITGTFGEPRSGHLHMGMDFSTGGEIGSPVLAVGSGCVVRMRAGASGYGRALYLQTDAGALAVYGHLDCFAPELETFLYERQRAQGEYEIDLHVAAEQFRFERGDTLACSGATGSGPPHLHFELRLGETAVNPLILGLDAPDLAGPVRGRIRLRALAPGAWVNGGVVAEAAPYDTGPITVWGEVGAEIAVLDRCGVTDARLAPLRVGLFLDGKPVFARIFERLDFSRGAELRRIYGRPFAGSKDWVMRLYRWPPGAPPDQVEGDAGSGIIDFRHLPPGAHTLCLEVEDAAGYISEASWQLDVRRPLLPIELKAQFYGEDGWLLGLRLAEPLDSLRLPLQLKWRPAVFGSLGVTSSDPVGASGAPAATSDRGRWMNLGQGWFAARVALPRPLEIEVLDCNDWPITPWVALGGRGPRLLTKSQLRVHVEEGGGLIEVYPESPFPGFPRARLVLESGEVVSLELRGRTQSGGWSYALATPAFLGRSRTLQLFLPGRDEDWEIPLTDLIGLPGPGGQGPGQLQAGWLTLRAGPDTFAGPALLSHRFIGPGDSLWQALVDESGRILPCGIERSGAGLRGRKGVRKADGARGDAALGKHARVEEAGQASGRGGELRILAPILELGPHWWPLTRPLQISISPDAFFEAPERSAAKWGLYRKTSKREWSWVGREETGAGRGGRTKKLGCFALLEDSAAPAVMHVDPPMGAHLSSAPLRLRAEVEEIGSGFDPRDADILLDGRMLLAVWDVDEHVLYADVKEPTGPGKHRWEVRIVDRVGNHCSEAFDFEIAAD